MRIVLLGAPGSGKGTQAQRLQAKYGVPQVSSGDLLRDSVARGTELGRKAKAVMDSGQLVCDDIVLGLIRDRLGKPDAARGFILDGFPRNIDQANSLNALLKELRQPIDAVLLLDVRRETLMKRLAGRRICPTCGTVYNVHSMPPGANTCSRDGAQLHQRPDDKEEVVGKRLEVYQTQTQPLIEHYSKLGLLRVVAGEGELEEVFERMEAAALTKPVPADKVQVSTRKARSAAKSAPARKKTAPARKAPARKSAKRKPRKKTAKKTAARRPVRAKRSKRVAKRKSARPRRATKARRR
jgi:adenylate kinase